MIWQKIPGRPPCNFLFCKIKSCPQDSVSCTCALQRLRKFTNIFKTNTMHCQKSESISRFVRSSWRGVEPGWEADQGRHKHGSMGSNKAGEQRLLDWRVQQKSSEGGDLDEGSSNNGPLCNLRHTLERIGKFLLYCKYKTCSHLLSMLLPGSSKSYAEGFVSRFLHWPSLPCTERSSDRISLLLRDPQDHRQIWWKEVEDEDCFL